MDDQQVINECVICGKVQIEDYWYHPTKAPPHSLHLRGAICDECWAHRLNRKKIVATGAGT